MFKLSTVAQSFVPQTKDYLIIIIILLFYLLSVISAVSNANYVFLLIMLYSFIEHLNLLIKLS